MRQTAVLLASLLALAGPVSSASAPEDILVRTRKLYDEGRDYDAGRIVRAAASRHPAFVPLRIADQNDLINSGQYAEALSYVQAAYERAPSPLNAYLFARIDYDRARARRTVRSALQNGGTHPGLVWLSTAIRAEDLGRAGKYEAALKILEESKEGMSVEPASVLQLRGENHAMMGHFDIALKLLREARTIDPQDAGIHLSLLGVLYAKGDREEMITALYKPPQNQMFAYVRSMGAAWSEENGQHAAALNEWRGVLDAPFDPYGWHATLAGAYAALGEQANALEESKAAAALNPDSPGLRLQAAYDLLRRDRAAGEAAIRREYDRNPRSVDCLRGQAYVDFSHGRYQEALELYDRAIALAPGIPDILVARAAVWSHLGDNVRTEADLRAVLKRYPFHRGAARELGRMHIEAGKYDVCMNDFERLAVIEKPEPEDLRLYALCCNGANHGERASAAMKAALDAAPDFGAFLNLYKDAAFVEARLQERSARYPLDMKAKVLKTTAAQSLPEAPQSAYRLGDTLVLGTPWGRQTRLAVLDKEFELAGTHWAADGKTLYYMADDAVKAVSLPSLSTVTVWAEAPRDTRWKLDQATRLTWFEVSDKTRELVATTRHLEKGAWLYSELLARPIAGGPVRTLSRRPYMERLESAPASGHVFVFGGGNLRVDPSTGPAEEFPMIGCILDMRPSPDGRKVVCVSVNSKEPESGELFLYDLDARKKTPLEVAGRRPAWSPDGTSIAYVWRDRQLRVLDLRTKSVAAYELPFEKNELALWQGQTDARTEWSKDGRFVYFTVGPSVNPGKTGGLRNSVVVDLKERSTWIREGALPTFEWAPARAF